jgi:hypothetical protein
MAVTWAPGVVTEGVASNGKRTKQVVLTATGTYTTGGDAFSPALIGLKGITRLRQENVIGVFDPGLAIGLAGTAEAPLIQASVAATGGSGAVAQVANATTLTGKIVAVFVEGY